MEKHLKIRYSESKNKNTIYFAKVLKGGIILRTSTNLNDISIGQENTLYII